MASSSTFAVVLVFMALGGVLAAEAAGRPSGTRGWNANNINTEDSGLQRLSVRTWLTTSPLDADTTSKFLAHANDNTLAQHGKEFCQEAKLQCDADIAIVDPTLRISRASLVDQELFQQTRDLVEASRAMQFARSAINKDSDIALPANLHDSYPTVAFLPQSLAEKMPFSSAKMPELLDSLNIPHDSNLAIMMSRTVGRCEAQEQGKETRKCVTSWEGMKTFVGSSLPQDKRIAALERSSSIPGDTGAMPGVYSGAGESRSKDNSWKVLDAQLYDRAVVCRNSVFPYAVFECHDTSKTNMHIYQVEMQGRDGSRIHEVAACHETSSLHDDTTSGPAQACHWVTDSLIWAPAN